MLTIQQKAQCVLWYHELKSPTAVQRKFRSEFGEDPPHTNSTVNEEMLKNTWREIEYRLDILRATNGAHVEVYQ